MTCIADSDMQKKKKTFCQIVRLDIIYIIFEKKFTRVETKCCTEKDDYMYKKDDRLPHQKSTFFIASERVGLSLDI